MVKSIRHVKNKGKTTFIDAKFFSKNNFIFNFFFVLRNAQFNHKILFWRQLTQSLRHLLQPVLMDQTKFGMAITETCGDVATGFILPQSYMRKLKKWLFLLFFVPLSCSKGSQHLSYSVLSRNEKVMYLY